MRAWLTCERVVRRAKWPRLLFRPRINASRGMASPWLAQGLRDRTAGKQIRSGKHNTYNRAPVQRQLRRDEGERDPGPCRAPHAPDPAVCVDADVGDFRKGVWQFSSSGALAPAKSCLAVVSVAVGVSLC